MKRLLSIQLGVWTTYGLVHFLASLPAITPDERGVIAFAKLVRTATGFGLTTALAAFLLPWRERVRSRPWLLAIAVAGALGFGWMILDRALLVTLAAALGAVIPWDRFPRGVELDYFFVALAWTLGWMALAHWEREQALRSQVLAGQVAAREAQLRVLAARLQPHFLFNTLNTIRSLIADDPERGRDMLTRLATLLRRVLEIDPVTAIPLAREMELTAAYLGIEQVRFEPDLVVDVSMAPDTRDVSVPPLLLQPLAENAVRHGRPGGDGRRHVRVSAERRDTRLLLCVANTGGLNGAAEREGGLGLTLTRERLAHIYPGRSTVAIAERGGWVEVTLEVDRPESTSVPPEHA